MKGWMEGRRKGMNKQSNKEMKKLRNKGTEEGREGRGGEERRIPAGSSTKEDTWHIMYSEYPPIIFNHLLIIFFNILK